MTKSNDRPWADAEIKILYERKLMDVPFSVIGKELGRHPDACRSKWRKFNWEKYNGKDIEREEIKESNVKSENSRLEYSVLATLEKFRLRADVIADRMAQCVAKYPEAPLEAWNPRKKTKDQNSPEDMCLVLSDLHIGHEHSAQETGGLSQYNLDIFKTRLKNLQYAVADIYEIHSNLYEIPRLHVMCLGDVVEGMNNAGQWSPVYINTPICDQVYMGFNALCQSIFYWLTIFPEVHFYGIAGNHGRIAQSGHEKDNNNWDNIIYDMLMLKFENNPRVKFHVPKTWWALKTIRNHKFLLVHGDDIKGKTPPLKSFMDFEQKMAGIMKQMPDYTIAGHFHNAAEMTTHMGRVIINGSFPGSDVYSLRNALPGNKPEQKLFGIHDERGITWTYNINLNVERKEHRDRKNKGQNKGQNK